MVSQAPQQRARRRRQRAAAAENANLWATPEHDDDDDDATPELEAPPEAGAAAPATVRSPSLSPCCKVEKKKSEVSWRVLSYFLPDVRLLRTGALCAGKRWAKSLM